MKHTNFSPLWISQNTQIEKHIKNLNHVNVMCEDKLKKKEVQWPYMYNFCRKKIRDKSSCTILVHDAIVSRWQEKRTF
jgi:hypothetical protein